uniref:Pachytene checkpoint protein 2 homolog n=1 Tax=Clastoptera arizonana TaxID=38151 RepID=A0A1B6BWW7_9HEMI
MDKMIDFVVQVEVLRNLESTISSKELKLHIEQEMNHLGKIEIGSNLTKFHNQIVSDNVDMILFCGKDSSETINESMVVLVKDVTFRYYIYRLNTEGLQVELMDEGGKEGEEQAAANHWILPSSDFHGLWDSLIYEDGIKGNLLKYAETIMMFSDRGVDPNIISWNRVVLLHGPPGTGKTSLCKALAHKLAIRMGHRYTHGQLVEINSHSLFSKYFSESGKLVVKMFTKIQELIEDKSSLVCVLIDEVESLTHARDKCSGSEPSDAIRVVNSVLTQIDHLRKYENVLILTTSNITGTIDVAFLDRADIKQYIGLPSPTAIYKIYYSCIQELIRTNMIEAALLVYINMNQLGDNSINENSKKLFNICRESEGISGRMLRKIPFLTYSNFISGKSPSMTNFLEEMEKTVLKCKREKEKAMTESKITS